MNIPFSLAAILNLSLTTSLFILEFLGVPDMLTGSISFTKVKRLGYSQNPYTYKRVFYEDKAFPFRR